ncbi:MAG: class I tRNA ligase family protein [Nitrosopumilus sp.]|nr:class I tRNA ligase family protein [Nitrosopumilus sp.]
MELGGKFDPRAAEEEARRHLEGADLSSIRSRSDVARFVEGPPTLNGAPHIGHLRGRIIKDVWYRHAVLSGRRVEFAGGWDTQGLPVELQAEKELGVTGGKSEAAERFGLDGVVAECKRVVRSHNREWEEADRMLGVSLDHSRSYWTCDDGYIEREWQVLRRALERGILVEDHAVIAYCPGCQTSLSHAEVGQGYEDVDDPSLYYKARLPGGEYLVVWTTMPFTLVTDAMVGVHPDEEYAYARVGGETWIVGASRIKEVMAEAGVEEYEVVRKVGGAELDGLKYEHPLLDLVPGLERMSGTAGYHTVVAERFVDAMTGSGLVHLSPANGEEDHKVAARRGVGVFCPIDDAARFTDEAGRYAGAPVREADRMVAADLEERGALVRLGRIRHSYPLCWRSRHRLLWLARRGWFYKAGSLGEEAAEAAAGVEYFFEQPRNRFLAIVGEGRPWCISRERVWGCPLPVWDCDACGKKNWHFTRRSIVDAAAELPDGPDFELHRPWIDRVRVRCSCGSDKTRREEYVLDTWHNSGAAPYASLTDAEYGEGIPAEFLTEGIDQTRGWAYTLLVENMILDGRPPYRSFLFQGHVLDEKGGKMSKSAGNVIPARDLLAEHPADLVRLYMSWKASPIEPLSFDAAEMTSRPYQVLGTLHNLHLYLQQNGGLDGFEPSAGYKWAAGTGLAGPADRWAVSMLQGLVLQATAAIRSCRFHEAARAIEAYVIDVLSQGYVPMTRHEIWDDSEDNRQRRLCIYAVLSEALRAVDVLLHPFCPFTTEHLYQAVFGSRESILLEEWPEADASLEDGAGDEAFALMREIVSAGGAARMRAGLKRRWPLEEARVCVGPGRGAMLEKLDGIMRAQLNVGRVVVIEAGGEGAELIDNMRKAGLPAAPEIKIDRRRAGPKAGRRLAEVTAEIEGADPADVLGALAGGGYPTGAGITLVEGEITVGVGAADGYAASSREGCAVFLSRSRSREMEARGLVRDIARRLQALRKERGYSPSQVLGEARVEGLSGEQEGMVSGRREELAFLVRARSVALGSAGDGAKEEEVDGTRIRISIG